MGVFAIKLDSVDIVSDVSEAGKKTITLTSVDPSNFDVSKSKIQMTICLQGRYAEVKRTAKPRADVVVPDQLEDSSSSEIDNSEGAGTPPAVEAPVVVVLEPIKVAMPLTPFQRAYNQAKADIRNGDNSPIRMQEYTLR